MRIVEYISLTNNGSNIFRSRKKIRRSSSQPHLHENLKREDVLKDWEKIPEKGGRKYLKQKKNTSVVFLE